MNTKQNQNSIMTENDEEEPGYQLVTPGSNENHSVAFGSAERVAQMMDPQFRQPNQAQQATASSTSTTTASSTTTPAATTNPSSTTTNSNDVPATSVFASTTTANAYYQPPMTFESLANSNANNNSTLSSFVFDPSQTDPLISGRTVDSFSCSSTSISPTPLPSFSTLTGSNNNNANLMSSTLNEYGPAQILLPPPPQVPFHKNNISGDFTLGPYIPPTSSSSLFGNNRYLTAPKQDPTAQQSKHPSPPIDKIPSVQLSLFTPTTTETSTTITQTSTALSTTTTTSKSSAVASTSSAAKTTPTTSTTGSTPATSSTMPIGKIPKITNRDANGDKADDTKYDEMEMITLQKRYRSVENDQKYFSKKRNEYEKRLNDMARTAHGKNIELDPAFKQLKDDKLSCEAEIQATRVTLKKISDVLLTKFDYKVMSASNPQVQPSRRAKMSTSARPQRDEVREPPSKIDKMKKLMFNFHESSTWCEPCDAHFDNVQEYCQHLHRHEHSQNSRKNSTPWRSHLEFIDKRKTYDLMKSICAKVGNELQLDFSVHDLDKIMTPNIDKEASRAIFLTRERGRFENHDLLLEPKGLSYLLPITGYYCNLCSKTLCDQVEVNLHLRSYDHNYSYIKSVALNPQYESSLRTKYERAYRRKYGVLPKGSAIRNNSNNGSDNKKDTNETSPEPSRLKDKSTRISRVDSAQAALALKPAPKITERKRSRDMPDIVAVSESRTKPSALKRLRTDRSSSRADKDFDEPVEKRNKIEKRPIQIEFDDEDEEQEREINNREEDMQIINEVLESLSDNETDKEIEEVEEEDEEDDRDETANDIQEVQLERGDPENPLPDLDLSISGNMHLEFLKDERLAKPVKIVLARLNVDDYKDMLFDSATLLTRVGQLIAKKEKIRLDFGDKIKVKPTYCDETGKSLPIDLEKGSVGRRKFKVEKKPKISSKRFARSNSPAYSDSSDS